MLNATAQLAVWLGLISAGLGSLFPPVIALIQQEHWGDRTKMTVTLILDGCAAVITVVGKGDWKGWNSASLLLLGTCFVSYFALSGLSYDKVWQRYGITPLIERLTTLRPLWTAFVTSLPASKQTRIAELEQQLAAAQAQAAANELAAAQMKAAGPATPTSPPAITLGETPAAEVNVGQATPQSHSLA